MTLAGGVTYTYDNNGNQTGRGADTFGYNAENRLVSTNLGGVAGSHAYNGDGLRTSRTVGGTTTTFAWGNATGMPVILRDSGGNRYLYGLDLISKSDSQNKKFYFHTDGLGSTTAITSSTGAVQKTYQYDVFGAIPVQTGTHPNEFTFTGEQVDSSGLEYLRARYYDQATGRFLSRDPLPFLQRYAYVGNNPVNYVDPSGDCLIEVRLKKVIGGDLLGVGLKAWHAYIYTYDPNDRTSMGFRAGPENGFGFRQNLTPGGYGKILGEAGSADFPNDISASFEGHKRTVLDDNSSCDARRASFKETMGMINRANINYHLTKRNSNSFVAELLESAGLSSKKPGERKHWTDKYYLPGWDTNLLD